MNPCPCGYYPDMNRCTCSVRDVGHYMRKISQPLLDRMDICVEAAEISYQDFQKTAGKEESSDEIRERVKETRQRQKKRYAHTLYEFNGELRAGDLEIFCQVSKEGEVFLGQIFSEKRMSARGYHKILKSARTIADIEGSEKIQLCHIQEAYGYRMIDKNFWGV